MGIKTTTKMKVTLITRNVSKSKIWNTEDQAVNDLTTRAEKLINKQV